MATHDKETLDVYGEMAVSFAKNYELGDGSLVDDWICKYFKPGSKILEVGAGSGKRAAGLIRAGYDVVASDGSEQMIRQAV
jgi:ubiquinone/menaquinone biosynthesis C-methylase UbiE